MAYRDDEADVLREFAEIGPAAGYDCQWLEPHEVLDRSQAVRAEGLKGGLWSATELTVDPRRVVAALPEYLRSIGVETRFGEAVRRIELPLSRPQRNSGTSDSAVVCSGDDFATLFPGRFRRSPVSPDANCK